MDIISRLQQAALRTLRKVLPYWHISTIVFRINFEPPQQNVWISYHDRCSSLCVCGTNSSTGTEHNRTKQNVPETAANYLRNMHSNGKSLHVNNQHPKIGHIREIQQQIEKIILLERIRQRMAVCRKQAEKFAYAKRMLLDLNYQ